MLVLICWSGPHRGLLNLEITSLMLRRELGAVERRSLLATLAMGTYLTSVARTAS